MPEQHFENDQGPPRRLLCQTSCCAFFDCLHSGSYIWCSFIVAPPLRGMWRIQRGKKTRRRRRRRRSRRWRKRRRRRSEPASHNQRGGKKQQSQQGHSNNYTLPTAQRTQTHTQPKRTSPKEVKKKGEKNSQLERFCTFWKFNPMEINKTTEKDLKKKITGAARGTERFFGKKKNLNNHNNNFNINTKRGNKITITIRYKCKVLATGMSKTEQEGCPSISYFLWQEVSLAAPSRPPELRLLLSPPPSAHAHFTRLRKRD